MALHALVFGGSGLSGWAITRNALEYPSRDTFASVTSLTNRPLSREDAALPDDPRLSIVNGIDLLKDADAVSELLKQRVAHAADITHVFFAALIDDPDHLRRTDINVQMLRTAVVAVTRTTQKLKHITLQTGGKWYGVEVAHKIGKTPGPYPEDAKRIAPPDDASIFYYGQHDALAELCAAQPGPPTTASRWTYSELRPNTVVGFAPAAGSFRHAFHSTFGIAVYLSLIRDAGGEGADAVFPGTPGVWRAGTTDVSTDVLARAHLATAVRGTLADGAGPSFNVADSPRQSSWQEQWPGVCAYFGLRGLPPPEDKDIMKDVVGDYVKQNEGRWEALVAQQGLRSSGVATGFPWAPFWGLYNFMDWNWGLDTTRLREAGFTEEKDPVEGYRISFDRMRAARHIPVFT